MATTSIQPPARPSCLGGGVAGLQCSLDLAEGGYKVYLVEKAPALGGHMAQLDKTFPTNDCSMCTLGSQVGRGRPSSGYRDRHERGADRAFEGEPGNFHATVYHQRPFRRPGEVHQLRCLRPGLPGRRSVTRTTRAWASGRPSTSSIRRPSPGTYAVDKKGYAPCKSNCPVQTSAQGYIALIAEGRFADAYRVASEPNPFPSVCGRVCAHPCETACTRGSVDEAISIAEPQAVRLRPR